MASFPGYTIVSRNCTKGRIDCLPTGNDSDLDNCSHTLCSSGLITGDQDQHLPNFCVNVWQPDVLFSLCNVAEGSFGLSVAARQCFLQARSTWSHLIHRLRVSTCCALQYVTLMCILITRILWIRCLVNQSVSIVTLLLCSCPTTRCTLSLCLSFCSIYTCPQKSEPPKHFAIISWNLHRFK